MRRMLGRFPVAVVRRVTYFVTVVASAITILNYTGSLPPWEDVRTYQWGTALEALLSNPWVVYPGALAVIGWTGIAIARWWETWVRWFLIPVKYTSVRSVSIHRGSEGRQQVFEPEDYRTKWVRRGKLVRLKVTGEAVIHAIEVPHSERVEFIHAPRVPQAGGAWWYQCKSTKQDGSEWMQYTTAVVEPNRNPERGNRIEDRSILCIVDRDTDDA
ncbi:MAG: hypothetical protein F4X09_10290 [Gammaproteobacteria bacterium]|nr:hypothetical protein [Gammaproteobacteria bacterium]